MFKLKKLSSQRGAMFGLDARISMAIFGTIAIAVGYTGISKLTAAKDAALYKEILAIEDAMDLMQTDLGVFYQFAIGTSNGANDIDALNDSSLIAAKYRSRWNGPYLEGLKSDHPLYGAYTILYRQPTGAAACNINNDCFATISLASVPASVWAKFNRMIDENNGQSPEGTPTATGHVRSTNTADPRPLLFYTRVKRKAG